MIRKNILDRRKIMQKKAKPSLNLERIYYDEIKLMTSQCPSIAGFEKKLLQRYAANFESPFNVTPPKWYVGKSWH